MFRLRLQLSLLITLTAAMAGCMPRAHAPDAPAIAPAKIEAARPTPLRIGTLRANPDQPVRSGDYASVDTQVARTIGEWLDRPLKLVEFDRQDRLLDAVASGELDLAVGVAWPLMESLPTRLSGFAYDSGEVARVCRGKKKGSKKTRYQPTMVAVPGELSGWLTLHRPAEALEDIQLVDQSRVDTSTLMAQVNEGEIDCALALDRVARIWSRYAPLRLKSSPVGLGFARYAVYAAPKPELGRRLARLFSSDTLRTAARRQLHHEFGFLAPLSKYHYHAFQRELKHRLPRYESLFRAAASHYDLDWRLLAAVGYQESHWQPAARSHTGVRGLMMLTRPTAREVGVKNRLDPYQSVWGGARYLRQLLDGMPTDAAGPDRQWLSLAAYNMGPVGLARAQDIARSHGLDPLRWADLSRVLRDSDDPKWHEAATYVKRIRDYTDIIYFHREERA